MKGADLERAVFRGAEMEWVDLRDALLWKADFTEATLFGAKLDTADLKETVLSKAVLWQASLSSTSLQQAKLVGTDLAGAKLDGADFRSAVTTETNIGSIDQRPGQRTIPTDLSGAQNLVQAQLNEMVGDDRTLLPKGLTRPLAWSDGTDHQSEQTDTRSDAAQGTGELQLRSQVELILRAPAVAHLTSLGVAEQLDFALQRYRAETITNQLPEDVLLVEKFSDVLKALGRDVSATAPAETDVNERLKEMAETISALQAVIANQASELRELKSAPKDPTSLRRMSESFASSFGKTLGIGAAGLVISGSGYLLGSYGADSVNLLGGAFSDLFSVAPPKPPSAGTTVL